MAHAPLDRVAPEPGRAASAAPLDLADDLIHQLLGPAPLGPVGRTVIPPVHDVLAPRLGSSDPGALGPGPEVDAALGRLVRLLTTTFGSSDPAGHRHHWDVVGHAAGRIRNEPDLAARAAVVQRAAAEAEALMEQHFARLLLSARPTPTGGSTPTSALARLLDPFPYTANYVDLVAAERQGLGPAGDGERVAFCGAGALPLTGVLWHLGGGARVTLIEISAEVAELAERFVGRLVDVGIIDHGAIDVVVGDATDLEPAPFDVVVVASLVPGEVLTAVAEAVAGCGTGGPLLLARSATGLTSLLAYEAVDLDRIVADGLVHLGTVAPESAVSALDLPDGLAVRPGPQLRHVAGPGVLNVTEYFAAP